jgi:Flp pilus assembly protein CpaB
MEPKKIALLVGALVIAAVTAVMAKNMFTQAAAPVAAAIAPAPTGPEVLVAQRSLPVGTIIANDSFNFKPWPRDLIQNAYYLKGSVDQASLAGTVVRAPISAGQPLTQGSLVKPGDRGFLAAALGPGMRAVTVEVSRSTGVAGFVFPGDRVDLMLTQAVENVNGPALKTTETFLRNVRVLATDQRTVPEDDKGKKDVRYFNYVTLEVTPRIAEKIQVAQTIGQLSMSLRSIADNTADLDRAIASGEIKVPNGTDPKTDKTALIDIAARPTDVNTTWVTGADVSRFQRKSAPSLGGGVDSGSGGPEAAIRRALNGMAGMMRARPNYGAASSMGNNGGAAPAAPRGPTVRVVRGNAVTEVSTGGN